jgi:hypothetical protein
MPNSTTTGCFAHDGANMDADPDGNVSKHSGNAFDSAPITNEPLLFPPSVVASVAAVLQQPLRSQPSSVPHPLHAALLSGVTIAAGLPLVPLSISVLSPPLPLPNAGGLLASLVLTSSSPSVVSAVP